MASDRSSHHKMTDSGQNGLSSTFSGKFPIKMLIQTVEKKKEEKHALVYSPCFVSVFPPPTGFKLNSWRALQFKVDRVADGLRRFKGLGLGRTMNEWDFMFFTWARRVILICLPASPSESLKKPITSPYLRGCVFLRKQQIGINCGEGVLFVCANVWKRPSSSRCETLLGTLLFFLGTQPVSDCKCLTWQGVQMCVYAYVCVCACLNLSLLPPLSVSRSVSCWLSSSPHSQLWLFPERRAR